MQELYSELDDIISFYENGTVTISDDISFAMPKVVRQITHYILSRYTEGGPDNEDPSTGRRRPFRNIGNFIVDLEWRAKNIDRKSIEAQATDEDYVFALLVNKELQEWMKDNNFGKTIDDYQRKKSEYGSVLLKKTETTDELVIEPVNWGTMKVDPRDIGNGPKIDQHFLTPLQLKKKAGIWDVLDLGIRALCVYCCGKREGSWPCHHRGHVDVSGMPEETPLAAIERRLACTACGAIGGWTPALTGVRCRRPIRGRVG